MIVRSLDLKNDLFRSKKEEGELLGPKISYLSAIGVLICLANYTQSDIVFAVNLLTRFNSAPTRRYWNNIKHIIRYLQATVDIGLLYPYNSEHQLLGYTDAGYLSDPHNGKS